MIHLPPPSILHNTEEIISACELAEVSLTCASTSGSNGISDSEEKIAAISNVTTADTPNPSPGKNLRFVLLTEMACLLNLQSYTHARHLWYRYRHLFNDQQQHQITNNPEFDQFYLLWKVGQSMILQKFPQVYSQLDECIQSGMEPLSTYARELRASYRRHMVRVMEIGRRYSTVAADACRIRLGFMEDGGEESMRHFLYGRGWVEERANSSSEGADGLMYWITGEEYLYEDMEEKAELAGNGNEGGDSSSNIQEEKIRALTNVVAFMERKRLNA